MEDGIVRFKSQKEINAARREQTDKMSNELLGKVERLLQANKDMEKEIRKAILELENDPLTRLYKLIQLHNVDK